MTLRKEKHVKSIKLLTLVGVAFAAMIAPAAADPAAATQRVAITSKLAVEKTFVLTALKAGAVQRDSGTVLVVSGKSRQVMRDGQKVSIFARGIYTFTGKKGTLTIRETTEWVDVSNVNTSYGYPRLSGSAPGRSCEEPASTPESPEAGEVDMRGSGDPGSRATRAFSQRPRQHHPTGGH
jgi:hypothetical protein